MQNRRREDVTSFAEYSAIKIYNALVDMGHSLKQRIKPSQIPTDALVLGVGTHPHHRKRKVPVYITSEQRARHIYLVGATGAGKTKFLEGLITQDIHKGNGFGLIDCHGDLVNAVIRYLGSLPPYNEISEDDYRDFQHERVVLIDPTYQGYSVGFNPLEVTEGIRPYAQALEMLGVFKKLWGYWGARMDELMRNTLVTLAESGLTLLEVQPLLTNDGFRMELVKKLSNVEARRYWQERFDPLSRAMKSQYSEPILNKTQAFVADPAIRSIVSQRKSTVNLREIMDQGKILLVNLSKGTLKENSLLLGALLVAKVQMAAMSRFDIPENQRRPWYLYVDEFQNFATESFSEILSEARKYGLSLIMAHQNLHQLDGSLKASILANVATQLYFGVSRSDAGKLASEMSISGKTRIQSELIQQNTREAYLKMRGEIPMAIQTPYILDVPYDSEKMDLVRRCAIKAYCRSQQEIEDEMDSRLMELDCTGGEIQDEAKPKFAPDVEFEEGK